MKEVKLFIDTTSLDQIQASMNSILSNLQESKETDDNMIDEIDSRIERIFDKLATSMRATIRAELKTIVEKEFQKLLVKMMQK